MYSPLVSKIIETPKCNIRKNATYNPTGAITKFTPHHTAGVGTPEDVAYDLQYSSRDASANYIIGNDGTIIGCVPEECRAWTSSSAANDYFAITVEVCNSAAGDPWPISDAAFRSLVNLFIDVARRYNMYPIKFTGDSTGNLTAHKFFAATACPGPYLYSKFPQLANEVNKALEGEQPMTSAEKQKFNELSEKVKKMGDLVDKLQKQTIQDMSNRVDKLEKQTIPNVSGRVDKVEQQALPQWFKEEQTPDWMRPTIEKLVKKKLLKGEEGGSLAITRDLGRTLVILDRAGAFDE